MACILIVDDHPLIRQGLAGVLTEAFPQSSVVEAADGPEAMRAVGDQSLDLVLLDLTLPGRNGLDLLREIKALRPRLPVLILSMHAEEQFATRALRSGAAGYLNKNSAPQVLIQGIQRAMAGGKVISAEIAERLAAELTIDASKPLHEQLSDREHDIFLRIGAGHSVSEIAESLHLSVKTVSTYRTRILNKMGKQNNSELMQYAIRNHLVE